MKKLKNLIVFLTILLFIPMMVMAAGYKTLNLEQTLTQEQIAHDLSGYQEYDDQVTIYMFRGNGCGYCQRFLTFLNSIVPEYGRYFKLVSLEVWNDKDNAALMQEIATSLNTTVSGVPFIIIGDKVFPGYASDYDEDIKNAIKNGYENTDGSYKDIVGPFLNKEEKSNTGVTIVVIVAAVAGIGFLIFMAKDNEEVVEEDEPVVEEKKVVKEVKTTSPKTASPKKASTSTKKSSTSAKKTTKSTSAAKKKTTTKK